MDKEAILNSLSDEVGKFISKKSNQPQRLYDDHHIIWGGNANSPIIVCKINADFTELFWAKYNKVHNCAFQCPTGTTFKAMALRNGFKEDDFLYINIIPFTRLGNSKYELDEINKLLWIYEEIIEGLHPLLIIPLGYESFVLSLGEKMDRWDYNVMLESPTIFNNGLFEIYPIEDPDIVGLFSDIKQKDYQNSLRYIYSRTYTIREQLHEPSRI